jgi:hypothetical protein
VRGTVDKVIDSVADIRGMLGEDRLEIQRRIAQATEHLGKVDATNTSLFTCSRWYHPPG